MRTDTIFYKVQKGFLQYRLFCLAAVYLTLFFFSACEKVINLKLNDANKKIVIEGTLNNTGEPVEVRISKSKTVEESNDFDGMSNAVVKIGVNDTAYTLIADNDTTGIYRTASCKGYPGGTYYLTVTVDGVTYTSTSVMPLQLVPLDTLTVEDLSFGGTTNKTIHPSYVDPPGLGNSYRLVEYVNGVQVRKSFPQNDAISDGLTITRPLIDPNGNIKSGDTLRVDLQCIDANIYKYWYSLDAAATGEDQNATPANPVSNINGGALGYFSAYTVSSKTIIVP